MLTKKEQAIKTYNFMLARVSELEIDVEWYPKLAKLYNEDTPEYGSNMQEFQKSKTQLAWQKIALEIARGLVEKYEKEEKNEAEKGKK